MNHTSLPINDDLSARRWATVRSRDVSSTDCFVYGVTSTGVFCRPGCPSRQPRRDRVCFFATAAEALAAGFRACRRCRPLGPDPVSQTVGRVAAFIAGHAADPVSVPHLARLFGISASTLQRQFKASLGLSPREYQAACRAQEFRRRLKAGSRVTDAIYEAGYGSPSRVHDAAPTGPGITPSQYRRGGSDQAIGFATVATSLGQLLVAATGKGVCAVKLGDSGAALEADLRAEFPNAAIAHDQGVAGDWVAAIVQRVEGDQGAGDVPLEVRGTAFQWRVWRELQRIPYGETRSYAEIAGAIGQPTAARAVARACATNPVCLVVPCHRVVGKDGRLSGYRWGKERKQQLLDRERKPRTDQ